MYCIKCGVKLADTENKCPLCNTAVYHPEINKAEAEGLYPRDKMPKSKSGRAFLCGAVIILFLIPIIVTFLCDLQGNGELNWFGYTLGGILIAYISLALPMWFKEPNPVIFLPCDFAAVAIYLFYINLVTGGDWFFKLAFPITLAACLIASALVTLLRYLKKGKLYVVGASVMALGALALMIELLIDAAFDLSFIGWSLYPLISLFLVGGLLIYLAMNNAAREKIERKLFF